MPPNGTAGLARSRVRAPGGSPAPRRGRWPEHHEAPDHLRVPAVDRAIATACPSIVHAGSGQSNGSDAADGADVGGRAGHPSGPYRLSPRIDVPGSICSDLIRATPGRFRRRLRWRSAAAHVPLALDPLEPPVTARPSTAPRPLALVLARRAWPSIAPDRRRPARPTGSRSCRPRTSPPPGEKVDRRLPLRLAGAGRRLLEPHQPHQPADPGLRLRPEGRPRRRSRARTASTATPRGSRRSTASCPRTPSTPRPSTPTRATSTGSRRDAVGRGGRSTCSSSGSTASTGRPPRPPRSPRRARSTPRARARA